MPQEDLVGDVVFEARSKSTREPVKGARLAVNIDRLQALGHGSGRELTLKAAAGLLRVETHAAISSPAYFRLTAGSWLRLIRPRPWGPRARNWLIASGVVDRVEVHRQRRGFILTEILGIVGAFAATYLGQAIGWYGRIRMPALLGLSWAQCSHRWFGDLSIVVDEPDSNAPSVGRVFETSGLWVSFRRGCSTPAAYSAR